MIWKKPGLEIHISNYILNGFLIIAPCMHQTTINIFLFLCMCACMHECILYCTWKHLRGASEEFGCWTLHHCIVMLMLWPFQVFVCFSFRFLGELYPVVSLHWLTDSHCYHNTLLYCFPSSRKNSTLSQSSVMTLSKKLRKEKAWRSS